MFIAKATFPQLARSSSTIIEVEALFSSKLSKMESLFDSRDSTPRPSSAFDFLPHGSSAQAVAVEQLEKRCVLTYFNAAMFASALEDALQALNLSGECDTALALSRAMIHMPDLLQNKYGIETIDRESDEDLNIVEQNYSLDCDYYKLRKLLVDRKMVTQTLQDTYQGLSLHNTFEDMYRKVHQLTRSANRVERLMEDETNYKNRIKDLKREWRLQVARSKNSVTEADETANHLKCEIGDAQQELELKSRYSNRYQNARSEQLAATNDLAEDKYLSSLQQYKLKIDQEEAVHAHMCSFVGTLIDEDIDRIESWMNKYDQDMDNIEMKIQVMKSKYLDMMNYRISLEEKYAKHKREMKLYVEFKDEIARKKAYVTKMRWAALVLQAWWRGMLVRLQLGPFRPVVVAKKKRRKGN